MAENGCIRAHHSKSLPPSLAVACRARHSYSPVQHPTRKLRETQRYLRIKTLAFLGSSLCLCGENSLCPVDDLRNDAKVRADHALIRDLKRYPILHLLEHGEPEHSPCGIAQDIAFDNTRKHEIF